MGQRLIIQIEDNHDPIANVYFHHGAYTEVAIELMMKIIEEDYSANTNILYKNAQTEEEKKLLWVVNLLRSTGAEIIENDLNEMKNKYPLTFGNFLCAKDRSEGLIALTRESMDNNNSWAAGTIFIDIETKKIQFGVLNWEDDIAYLIDEEYIENVEDLPELSIDLDELTFGNFDEFYAEIKNIYKTGESFFKNKDGEIYSIIG